MLSRFRFVLVRPRNPENIGAAARAIANFGFSNLAVVSPHPPVWTKAKAAMGGRSVLQQALRFDSIGEAIKDCSTVLGTDSTARRRPSQPVLCLRNFSPKKEGTTAVLFGSEKTGLTNEELSFCSAILAIPTAPNCLSMNLGQAVAVIAWEISKGSPLSKEHPPSKPPATAEQLEALAQSSLAMLRKIGYLDWIEEDPLKVRLRETLAGWKLKRRDLTLMHQIVRRILRESRPRGN